MLDPGDRQGTGGLADRARVLEDVLDGGADLVVVDQHDLVDEALRQGEGLLAYAPDRDAVRKQTDALERNALAGLQRFVHGRRIFGLDTDDLDARIDLLDECGNAGNQAAAADRHEHGVDLARGLPHDFQADRALPGNDVDVVERMHEHQVALARDRERVLVGGVVAVSIQHDFRAEFGHGAYFDLGSGARHHHHGRDAALACGQRHALGVVARGRADDTVRSDRR